MQEKGGPHSLAAGRTCPRCWTHAKGIAYLTGFVVLLYHCKDGLDNVLGAGHLVKAGQEA